MTAPRIYKKFTVWNILVLLVAVLVTILVLVWSGRRIRIIDMELQERNGLR